MEILITISNIFLIIFYLFITFKLLNKINNLKIKYPILLHFIHITLSFTIFSFFIAWWSHFSVEIVMYSYGYNFYGYDSTEYYKNVKPENLEKVKKIKEKIMGIGWPLVAIFRFVFFYPFALIIYFIINIFKK